MSLLSSGQVVSNYSIILNNDKSPLEATVKDKNVVLNFHETDVLTFTFKDLKPDISKTTIKIISASLKNDIIVGTFDKSILVGNDKYTVDIAFNKFKDKLHFRGNNIYSIVIQNKKARQNLLTFKLLSEGGD